VLIDPKYPASGTELCCRSLLPNISLYGIQTPGYIIASRLYTVLASPYRVAYIAIRYKKLSKGHISAPKATGTVHIDDHASTGLRSGERS
jgi:hypothetical protein